MTIFSPRMLHVLCFDYFYDLLYLALYQIRNLSPNVYSVLHRANVYSENDESMHATLCMFNVVCFN